MYFDKFPKTYYTFDSKTATLVTDFMARVALAEEIRNNAVLYDPYTIIDGETPEVVADKVYGNPFLHWVILLTNEIINPYLDWCVSQERLLIICQHKYDDIYATHHYEDETGLAVDSDAPGAYPVSNYEYEERLNEDKRVIRILNANLVKEFIKEFEDAMGS